MLPPAQHSGYLQPAGRGHRITGWLKVKGTFGRSSGPTHSRLCRTISRQILKISKEETPLTL